MNQRCTIVQNCHEETMSVVENGRLTEKVRRGLAKLIADENLQPGDKLPPADRLCEQFGVSRTVVREAIASLRAEGRLRSLRGSGVYVSERPRPIGGPMFMEAPQNVADVLDFLEFRMSIDIGAAGLAAERRTETNLLRMEQAMKQGHSADNSLGTDADRAFHHAIAEATYNSRFRLFDEIAERLVPDCALGGGFTDEKGKAEILETIQAEHRSIVDAIVDRKPNEARGSMRRHLEGERRRYRGWSLANEVDLGRPIFSTAQAN